MDRGSESKPKPLIEQRTKRFETLPSDIECVNKFQMIDKRRKQNLNDEHTGKKQFIEVDILNLESWYAKN